MADDQRIRPTIQGRARLLRAVEAVPQAHAVDAGVLGEYAQIVAEQGQPAADRQLLEVGRHLATGCATCADDLDELISLLAVDAPPSQSVLDDAVAFVRPAEPSRALPADDSGIHLRDLPDPRRAEAEAVRRQQLRRMRERLLIAAAVAVVVMGLSLIGLAYLARAPQETPRLDLAPLATAAPSNQQPAVPPVQTAPAAPAAPAQSAPAAPAKPAPAAPPAQVAPSAGIAAPDGMDCPASHPIKGNRDSMIYHVPGGGFYGATRPEQCFAQPSDAEAAGYRRSQR